MTWPTITTTNLCPNCHGDGITTLEDCGQFDTHAEQWYPTHTNSACDTCDGIGELLTTQCRMCGDLEDNCTCTEDDFDAWNNFEVAA
jgi:DnaJ-class molecular chaperone